jgi:hypothetical protein
MGDFMGDLYESYLAVSVAIAMSLISGVDPNQLVMKVGWMFHLSMGICKSF